MAAAVHKTMEERDSYVSDYYEEEQGASNGRKTWLPIPFCRYMVRDLFHPEN